MLGRGTGGRRDPAHRAQRTPGEDPAEDSGHGDDHGNRDQRVLQKVRQGELPLPLRALLLAQMLEVREALGKDALVGMRALRLGLALPSLSNWCET